MKWIVTTSLDRTSTKLIKTNLNFDHDPLEVMQTVGELSMLIYLISQFISVLTLEED
jgi:hypothetical protein